VVDSNSKIQIFYHFFALVFNAFFGRAGAKERAPSGCRFKSSLSFLSLWAFRLHPSRMFMIKRCVCFNRKLSRVRDASENPFTHYALALWVKDCSDSPTRQLAGHAQKINIFIIFSA
jgi:hypothetical protein